MRRSSSLSSGNMIKEAEVSIQKFERLAQFFHENDWLPCQKSNDSKIQYEEFLKSAVISNKY